MPQLRRFTIENFKCFREATTFEFSDVNLLYGKNSAGKSSLFDAIEYFKIAFNTKGSVPGSWDEAQRQYDFRRIVSDQDLNKQITLCADFTYEHSDKRSLEVAHEGFDLKLDAMVSIGDLPKNFMSSFQILCEEARRQDNNSTLSSQTVLNIFPLCPPLLTGENVAETGISMQIGWSKHQQRPFLSSYKLRVNKIDLVSVRYAANNSGHHEREAPPYGNISMTGETKLNPEHPCLPYAFVNPTRVSQIYEILECRRDRGDGMGELEQILRDIETPDTQSSHNQAIEKKHPNEWTASAEISRTSIIGWLLSEETIEFAKLKSVHDEMPELPGQGERVRIGQLDWCRPLPSEILSDSQLKDALLQQRLLKSERPRVAPWLCSALRHRNKAGVVDQIPVWVFDLSRFELGYLCDSRYGNFDRNSETYWESWDEMQEPTWGSGSPHCSEDEKNWNAFVYHCSVLGYFCIGNVRDGFEAIGRVPPIRERMNKVSDLEPEMTSSINQWLSHDDGFQLGVRIRSTHEIVREELHDTVASLSSADAEFLTHRLVDLTHRFGRFEDAMLVNQDNLPVRSEEIGTGVSQLIPVVVQAFRSGIQMFEQPELHLHAEPQLVLGDMFLDAKCQAFLETHSLPLLLRIMRRIREQTKWLAEGTHEREMNGSTEIEIGDKGPERLLAEAVRVWHIRDHEGSSRAEEIRIDNEGMLIDEWPDELFDVKFREVFGR